MPYMCIITERQNSRIWDGGRNQVPRPVYSSAGVFRTQLGEWVQLSNFGRRFSRFVVIGAMTDIASLVGPRSFRVAGKSVDEYDAFQSV